MAATSTKPANSTPVTSTPSVQSLWKTTATAISMIAQQAFPLVVTRSTSSSGMSSPKSTAQALSRAASLELLVASHTSSPAMPAVVLSPNEQQQPSRALAYAEDIPGTRCGPEDGPWPKPYTVLRGKLLWDELSSLARPQSRPLDAASGPSRRVDSLNFQPSRSTRTQDRYVVRELDIYGRIWVLTGVFDGHLGDATVEHTAYNIPIIIRDLLLDAFKDDPHRRLSPQAISDILSHSITSFDDAIAGDVLKLFPGGMAALREMSNAQIAAIINDQYDDGRGAGCNYNKARLCMYGTTALVSLVDPERENLWVANLGDCQAALITHKYDAPPQVDILTVDQNGDNEAEVIRVRAEHPGESDCVMDGRVLGAIAPFRCIGDTPFKQPPEFTRRILYNLYPGFHNISPWEEFLRRNLTPPYISSVPDITHRTLDPGALNGGASGAQSYLAIYSDGFTDLCHHHSEGTRGMIANWARQVLPRAELKTDTGAAREENLALTLLRHALGGEDLKVSPVLTLEMDTAWIDDTALVVSIL